MAVTILSLNVYIHICSSQRRLLLACPACAWKAVLNMSASKPLQVGGCSFVGNKADIKNGDRLQGKGRPQSEQCVAAAN